MKGEKIQVVVAEDNVKLRSSIRRFLERAADILVAGEADNGQDTLSLVERLKPDVLILDIRMPILDGLAVMKMLRQQASRASVIILSGINDPYIVAESIICGAHSYILKEDAPAHIISVIHRAARGESGYISPLAEKSMDTYRTTLTL